MLYSRIPVTLPKALDRGATMTIKQKLLAATKSQALRDAIRAGVLMSGGDIVCQLGIEKHAFSELDLKRNLRLAGFGVFFAGPAFTKWYKFLDGKIKPNGIKSALKKTACDQLIFAPSMLSGFLIYNGVAQGHSVESIKQRFKDSYWKTQLTNWSVIPGMQLANFYFVPAAYRVIVVQLLSVFRNTVLALAVSKKQHGEPAVPENIDLPAIWSPPELPGRPDHYPLCLYRISFNLF